MRPLLALALLLATACPGPPPRCPPADAVLPATTARIPWEEPARPVVTFTQEGMDYSALLDTGMPRSTARLGVLFFRDGSVQLQVGPVIVSPIRWDLAPVLPADIDALIGADFLAQVPMVLDARAGEVRVEPNWIQGACVAPLTRWSTGLCRADDPTSGPEGPDLFLVEVELEGQPLTMVLDTGADHTIARQSAIADLASRPSLTGLPLSTRFAGAFPATATRARSLSVGGQATTNTPVLVAPELDVGLETLRSSFRDPPPRLDGLLGRSFLREFEVSLALGDDAATARALGLTRFSTQAHWTRDFVGIGVATSRNDTPPALRIGAVFPRTPAQAAGLQAGDLITTVNGQPALHVPQPWGAPGDAVQLVYHRGALDLPVTITIADLLPDPPP